MPAIAPATIAELARRSGVDVASIRLYERVGLLPKPRRRRGRSGDAAYHQEHLDRLVFIRRALDLGFSFEDIAELAGLKGGLQTCNDIYQIVERHRAGLQQRGEHRLRIGATLKILADACPKKGPRSDCRILAYLSRPNRMLNAAFDHKNRVLRVVANGVFTSNDMEEIERVAIEVVAREGQVRGIFDYTDVEAFAVPEGVMARRAQQPLILREQRVIVASRIARGEVARIYVRYQREAGRKEVPIVDNLEEAYRVLQLGNPRFEPIERLMR